MRPVSQTLIRLDGETRAFHAEMDGLWLDLVAARPSPTRLDYIAHLSVCYGFDASLEAALAYTPHLTSFVDVHPRFRAGYIAEDLLSLDVSPAAIAELSQPMIAPFATISDALGWLYVHQRSTMHHDRLRTQLLERLPEVAYATSYLRRNADRVDALWDELGEAIDKAACTARIEQRIVTAAIDASRAAIHWYRRPAARRQREAIAL